MKLNTSFKMWLFGGGVLVLAFMLWSLRSRATPEAAGPVLPATVTLPAACQVRVQVDLRALFAQPAFSDGKAVPLALSGVLGGANRRTHSASELLALTRSGSFNDIQKVSVCQLGTSGAFVAALTGAFKPDALRELARRSPDKWRVAQVAGLPVLTFADQQPPFMFQARDNSLLLASSQSDLELALKSHGEPPASRVSAEGASMWARIDLPSKRPMAATGPVGLDGAKDVVVRMDFDTRKVTAALGLPPGADANAAAGQLRVMLSQPVPDAEHPESASSAVAYVAKRAIISSEPGAITIESELNDAAIGWFSEQIMKRARLSSK